MRAEAEPEYVGPFDYRLEGVLDLPELHGCGDLSQGGRRVFSRLVFDSIGGWSAGWEQATVRKVGGEASVRPITSPLKHWLGVTAWFSDGVGGERLLAERWLVPMSLLRGQRERFRHLRPLSLELSRRLDGEAELLGTLQRLGLNVYPTDGERIGPELLDALAEAWRTEGCSRGSSTYSWGSCATLGSTWTWARGSRAPFWCGLPTGIRGGGRRRADRRLPAKRRCEGAGAEGGEQARSGDGGPAGEPFC